MENHIGVIRGFFPKRPKLSSDSTLILSHMLWDRPLMGAANHYMLWSGPMVEAGQPFERARADAAARFAEASRFWSRMPSSRSKSVSSWKSLYTLANRR